MCVQRIVAAKDQAREAGREVKDGDMQTACQQTCPTQAITFGNLKDASALVSQAGALHRGATTCSRSSGPRPGVTYLKKVVRREPAGPHGKPEGGHKA